MSKLIDVSKDKQIREEILELLKEAGYLGLSLKVIELAFKELLNDDKKAIKEALYYLESKSLIIKKSYKNERLKIYKDIYQISSKGIDVLDGSLEEIGLGV